MLISILVLKQKWPYRFSIVGILMLLKPKKKKKRKQRKQRKKRVKKSGSKRSRSTESRNISSSSGCQPWAWWRNIYHDISTGQEEWVIHFFHQFWNHWQHYLIGGKRGQKRKSEVASSAGDDDEQLVPGVKKAKIIQNDPSNPPQLLKAQSASSQKSAPRYISGDSIEIVEKKAATRKHPAKGGVVDETPVPTSPSKKVKGNANANKPQPLRRSGLFFYIWICVRS